MLPQGRVSARFYSYRGVFIALSLAAAWFVPQLAAEGPRQQAKMPAGSAHADAAKSPTVSNDANLKARVRLAQNYGKLPLRFEANQGQTDKRVQFLSRGSGYALFLTGDEAVLMLRKPSALSGQPSASGNAKLETGNSQKDPRNPKPESRIPSVLRMKLAGANANARVSGLEELPGKSNYFLGNDPKKWRTNVPNYGKVKYEDVYPGVDLVYYGNQRQLEYDFVVAPGADPRAIRLGIVGAGLAPPSGAQQAAPLRFDANGNLVISTEGGEVRFHKPAIYQPKSLAGSAGNSEFRIQNSEPVEGKFKLLADSQVGFEVANYDKSRPLVIDPTLTYAAYLGGSSDDVGYAIAVDSSGSAYLTGYTSSIDLLPLGVPHLPPPNDVLQGPYDAFVAKVNADGTALDYATYLGGTDLDEGVGIAVDSAGNAYITGDTWSSDFPTMSPFQAAFGGGVEDAFVAKLSATGDSLVYSSYLGGSQGDVGNGIAIDSSGNAYVTGYTGSTDFLRIPATNPPMQASNAGLNDAFVTEVSADGSTKVYSTYLGGSGTDYGAHVAVDASGNAYVTGATDSTDDFPTVNPLPGGDVNGGSPGTTDAFVTKLNADGSGPAYSTYLGGSDQDSGRSIAVDSSGNAYVTGLVSSLNFPVVNFLQLGPGGGQDIFVSKINSAGSAQVYTAILGGANAEAVDDIKVDSNGSAYIVGVSESSDYPLASPLQGPETAGNCEGSCGDIVVSKINPAGNALIFSTYLGGDWIEDGTGIALDTDGNASNAYVVGQTNSPTSGGAYDVYVAKLSDLALPVTFLAPTSTFPAPSVLDLGSVGVGFTSTPQTVTLENRGDALLFISSIAADGDFHWDPSSTLCSSTVAPGPSGICLIGVTVTPSTTGTLNGTLTITETNSTTHTQALTATGTPASAVVPLPTVLSFPDTKLLESSPVSDLTTVTLTNSPTATAPLTFSYTTLGGDFVPGPLPATPGAPACPQSGGSLDIGQSCRISLVFTPTTTGLRFGTLQIDDNAPGSPHVVGLTGRGLSLGVVGGLPASLPDFGNVLLDAAGGPQTVTLSNTGTGPMQILSIYTDGYFEAATDCPSTLEAGAPPCDIHVLFIPYEAGPQTGYLYVSTDADPSTPEYPGGQPTIVALSGTGVTDVVQLFPRNLLFGERPLNDTSPAKTITVTNTGSTAVTLAPAATGDFEALPGATNPCGASLDPGVSCTFDVTFTPTVDGRRDGTLTITTNAPDNIVGPEVAHLIGASAIRDIPGFEAHTLPANDDGSTDLIPLPFTVNFFGTADNPNLYSGLYVNNNGNVTFDSQLGIYTPFGLTGPTGTAIIAPFFADVDTVAPGSNVVTYGTGTVDGHLAFGVNWINVGYFGYYDPNLDEVLAHDDKLNSFQLVLIDRSDTGAGNFDIEMNYAMIDWETGDASDGIGGLYGSSARAGYSKGTGEPGTFYELTGSAVNGAFLDSNPETGLIHQLLNGTTPGGYRLLVRGGAVVAVEVTPVSAPNFPGNPVGVDCPARDVRVTNTGQAALTITDISFPPGSLFTAQHDCNGGVLPATLAAGAPPCTISVKFEPTDEVVNTTVQDTLTVTTDAPGPPSTVVFTGTATPRCTPAASMHALTVLRGTESAGVDVQDANPSCSPVDFNLTCTLDHPAQCALNPTVIPPSGSSRLTVSNLRAVEADSVRVVVNAVSEFRLWSESVSVLLSSFAFTQSPDTASVVAGETASYSLAIRPVNGLSGPVSLACSGAPRGATCTVTPASFTLDGTHLVWARLKVTTTARAGVPGGPFGLPPLHGPRGVLLLLFGLLLAAGAAMSLRRRRLTACLLAGTLLMLLGWAACGGGGGSVSLNSGGTPAGTYTLTVTGTYTNAPGSTPSTLTNSTTVTLHVN